jgi:hypothetical protein
MRVREQESKRATLSESERKSELEGERARTRGIYY